MARLSIYRSNCHIYAQIIDDQNCKTLTSASDLEITKDANVKKIDKALEVGELIAQKAKKLNILQVVFDRGKNKYHGRVKAVAESARKQGLKI